MAIEAIMKVPRVKDEVSIMELETILLLIQRYLKEDGLGAFSYASIIDGAMGKLSKKQFEKFRSDSQVQLCCLLNYSELWGYNMRAANAGRKKNAKKWLSTDLSKNRKERVLFSVPNKVM